MEHLYDKKALMSLGYLEIDHKLDIVENYFTNNEILLRFYYRTEYYSYGSNLTPYLEVYDVWSGLLITEFSLFKSLSEEETKELSVDYIKGWYKDKLREFRLSQSQNRERNYLKEIFFHNHKRFFLEVYKCILSKEIITNDRAGKDNRFEKTTIEKYEVKLFDKFITDDYFNNSYQKKLFPLTVFMPIQQGLNLIQKNLFLI